MFRTVCFGYSKDRSCDRTGSRVDAAIQRFGNRVQLADVNRISVCHTFGYVGDFVAAIVQTGSSQRHLARRAVCTNLQTVGSQYAVACDNVFGNYAGSFYGISFDMSKLNVVFSLNRQIFAAAFHSDVLTLFHGHGVARSDFLAVGFVVRFQVPAFISSFFNCGNGFVDVVFTCTTNVVGRNVAVVVGCVAAQDGCQVHLGSIQLGFGRGFVRSGQWGAAQCGVGQSANNTFFTVNHDRFAAVRCVFADGDFLGQAEVDRFACAACGNDVLVFACVGNGIAQVDFFRRPVVRNNIQALGQLVAHFVQCFLNSMYRSPCRTVRLFDGKVRRCDWAVCIDSRIQRCCQRFDLADVHTVRVFRTFGYFGNLITTVTQSGRGQRHLARRIIRTNFQTLGSQDAVACDNGFCNHIGGIDGIEFNIV